MVFRRKSTISSLTGKASQTAVRRYSSDAGLLITQTFANRPYTENELYRALMLDKLSVNEGMVAENAVAQALRANRIELYFYSRPDKGDDTGRMEIDFLVRRGDAICPVEVKSGASHLPLYMAMLL